MVKGKKGFSVTVKISYRDDGDFKVRLQEISVTDQK
jgi:hypothetical protein